MSATDYPCPCCSDETTRDGLLGPQCTARLRSALRSLPELMRELKVNYTRQSQAGSGNGGKGRETALMYDYNSSEVFYTVENTIGTWIRSLMEDYSEDQERRTLVCGGHACTVVVEFAAGPNITTWCEWLIKRLHRIRGHVAVQQIVDELLYSARIARQAIDRPADREYVCLCAICDKEVFAREGSTEVQCSECRKVAMRDDDQESETYGEVVGFIPTYGVEEERMRRLDALRGKYLNEQQTYEAVAVFQHEPLSPKTFRSWLRRYHEGVTERRAQLPPRACSLQDVERDDQGKVTGYTALYHVEEALTLAALVSARAPGHHKRQRLANAM